MDGADAALRRVHEAGYRFPPEFAGFRAAFQTGDGACGSVTVRGQRSVELSVDGAPTANVEWARDAVASIVSHGQSRVHA